MTSQGSRQFLALVALLAFVLVVVYVRRADAPASSPAAASNRTRGTAPAASTPAVADVRLEVLKASETDLEPATRNPFQFKSRALPPPQVTAPTRGPVIVAPPPLPPGPPPLPPIALKFIGVLDTAQGRVAVLRDGGGDIVNGKEGDIIDGRYRLLKIGVESADLSYVDGRGRQSDVAKLALDHKAGFGELRRTAPAAPGK